MGEKIFGWFLLIAGLLIIGWGLVSSFSIFRDEQLPPTIFAMPEVQESGAFDPQDPAEIIQQQLGKILPVNTLPQLLNLSVWVMFMTVLFLAGGQISGIGIKLIKSKIVIKEEEVSQPEEIKQSGDWR